MLNNLIFFAIGLIVGWNIFPQPTWVKSFYDLIVSKIKNWAA